MGYYRLTKFSSLLIFMILCSSWTYTRAQTGTIRGTVIDDATGEPMIGVTIVVEGSSQGTATDFEGSFSLELQPGVYNLQVSFISYKTLNITSVNVVAGEINALGTIRLSEDIETLEDVVVVTADVIRNNEAALLTVKRKSANLLDGISADNFRKIGDSDAGAAIKRVTGVSVEGGKYVYVRGLGDRYTKTMLNSVDIPGLDPDRNSLQIDIFPTNLIDNMIVLKTALADLPADFTGGVVNIETKDLPDEKILDVSLGITYNPSMHFQDDFLDYEGSDTDWLGFDSDLRDLPPNPRDIPRPLVSDDDEVLNFSKSLSPVLAGKDETSFLDYSLGISLGNQIDLGSKKLGYIFSGTYKTSRTLYDDAAYGEYQRPTSQSDNDELIAASIQNGRLATKNVLLGGLGGLTFKGDNAKYTLTALHLQNGESKAGQFRIVSDPEDERNAVGKSNYIAENSNNIEYSQRSLTNILLSGEHHVANDKWIVDWRLSPTFSDIKDPDIRVAAFTTDLGEPELDAGAAGFPTRIWRFLDETNLVGRLDITRNLELFNSDAKIKLGGYYTYKDREYEILSYNLAFFGSQPDWELDDPNIILVDENLYPNSGNAYYQSANVFPNPNAYQSDVNNIAGYVSIEMNPFPKLKTILGLRVEDFTQKHTGRDQDAAGVLSNAIDAGITNLDSVISVIQNDPNSAYGNALNDDKVLDATDFFPSVNLIYELKELQNIRLSYSRTIARPSFKELSYAQILDPISNRTFNGGLFSYNTNGDSWDGNLSETRIDNIDLRWELFAERGQTLSVSTFYKRFDDPIELVRIPSAQTNNEFQPRNVGDGQVYGAELEFRKSLDFVSPRFNNFYVNSNVTFTESVLDMTDVEFNARKDYERPGQDVDDTREMAGQAPFVINAGIGYEDFDIGLDAGLFYNVQGETLVVVGGGLFPDVYSEPFHSVNFNINKSFGEDDGLSLNLSVSNILNDKREQFYQGHDAEDQIFTSWSPGISFGVGIGYKF